MNQTVKIILILLGCLLLGCLLIILPSIIVLIYGNKDAQLVYLISFALTILFSIFGIIRYRNFKIMERKAKIKSRAEDIRKQMLELEDKKKIGKTELLKGEKLIEKALDNELEKSKAELDSLYISIRVIIFVFIGFLIICVPSTILAWLRSWKNMLLLYGGIAAGMLIFCLTVLYDPKGSSKSLKYHWVYLRGGGHYRDATEKEIYERHHKGKSWADKVMNTQTVIGITGFIASGLAGYYYVKSIDLIIGIAIIFVLFCILTLGRYIEK